MNRKIKLMATSAFLIVAMQLVSACCLWCPSCCIPTTSSSAIMQSDSAKIAGEISTKSPLTLPTDESE